MKLGNEERSVRYLVREHRRLPMNVIFDAEYATTQYFVIKARRLNILQNFLDFQHREDRMKLVTRSAKRTLFGT